MCGSIYDDPSMHDCKDGGITPQYPPIREDVILTDWYAGAYTESNHPAPRDGLLIWDPADAVVAFSEIGYQDGDGRVHAQLVTYALGHDGRLRAISAEIDPDDARKIAAILTVFADEADADSEPRDPYDVYGTPEHEALLIAEERGW
jgi:hypothetical protein